MLEKLTVKRQQAILLKIMSRLEFIMVVVRKLFQKLPILSQNEEGTVNFYSNKRISSKGGAFCPGYIKIDVTSHKGIVTKEEGAKSIYLFENNPAGRQEQCLH